MTTVALSAGTVVAQSACTALVENSAIEEDTLFLVTETAYPGCYLSAATTQAYFRSSGIIFTDSYKSQIALRTDTSILDDLSADAFTLSMDIAPYDLETEAVVSTGTVTVRLSLENWGSDGFASGTGAQFSGTGAFRATVIVGAGYVSSYIDSTLVETITTEYTSPVAANSSTAVGGSGGGSLDFIVSRVSIVAGAYVPSATSSSFWTMLSGTKETV